MSQDNVLICEYQSRTISCPSDQVIEIVYANYGRTSIRPCAWGTHHDTNCTLPSAINTAREVCNGRNSCELVAKNSMWKVNPCPGIIKYVEVKYICNEVAPQRKWEYSVFFFDREKWFKLNLSQFSFFFNALLYILAVAPESIVALG